LAAGPGVIRLSSRGPPEKKTFIFAAEKAARGICFWFIALVRIDPFAKMVSKNESGSATDFLGRSTIRTRSARENSNEERASRLIRRKK
jgi:hypothetical protein